MPGAQEISEHDAQIKTLEGEIKKAIASNEEDLDSFRKRLPLKSLSTI